MNLFKRLMVVAVAALLSTSVMAEEAKKATTATSSKSAVVVTSMVTLSGKLEKQAIRTKTGKSMTRYYLVAADDSKTPVSVAVARKAKIDLAASAGKMVNIEAKAVVKKTAQGNRYTIKELVSLTAMPQKTAIGKKPMPKQK